MFSDVTKAAGLLFVAALLQATIFSSLDVLGGTADVLLVTVVAVALLRGSLVGAVGGFVAGLVVDVANLQTLGMTSLLLTLAGYWTGRYGETTGRDRARAPALSVAAVTIGYAVVSLALHFVLGDAVSVRVALVDTLVPALALNLIVAIPVFRVTSAALRPFARPETREVRLLG